MAKIQISSHVICPNRNIKLMLQERLLPLLQWVRKRELRVVSRFKKNHQFYADQMQPQMIDFEVTIAHKNSKSLFLKKYLNFKDFSW